MNQNQFFKYLLIAAILFSLLMSRGIQPNEVKYSEFLTIKGKDREYFQLHDNSLSYDITGPQTITIFARRAIPKKDEKLHVFGFQFLLNESEQMDILHKKKKWDRVTSKSHPGHGYTSYGKYIIKIPKGNNKIVLNPINKKSGPVLIRITTKDFKKSNSLGNFIELKNGIEPTILQISKKRIRYYELTGVNGLEFKIEGPQHLKISSRLAFEEWMTKNEPYRIRIIVDGQIVSTCFYTTEKSTVSTILNDKTLVPGKRRNCEIDIKKGEHLVKIELLNQNKKAFIRPMAYGREKK